MNCTNNNWWNWAKMSKFLGSTAVFLNACVCWGQT